MTGFMDGYDTLAETCRQLLINNGVSRKEVDSMTRHQVIKAVFEMTRSAVAYCNYEESKS